MPISAFRLSNLEEHVRNGEIPAQYFVFTQAESEEPILQVEPTKIFATVGPYTISEVDNEK